MISIGHSHPRYVDAVSRQVSQLAFYSNSVKKHPAATPSPTFSVRFPVMTIIALSCQFRRGSQRERHKTRIFRYRAPQDPLPSTRRFHGRTSAAVAATDNPRIQAPVNKTDNIVFSPSTTSRRQPACSNHRNSQPSLSKAFRVAGIRMVDDDFLRRLSEVAAATGTLLIADEIQSGYGRTGKFFAHQHAGYAPT